MTPDPAAPVGLDLEALKELLAKAHNPLPWNLQADTYPWNRNIIGGTLTVLVEGGRFKWGEDAELIVAAVNALPALLDLVSRLQGFLKDAFELLQACDSDYAFAGSYDVDQFLNSPIVRSLLPREPK